ncbi:restriction endonuclease subunit S [Mycobacteroides chelonae]|uniref:restriction endonuclease subunit S n=1 Tax=Mycobacteroides chelonae TaxID=1774 RepID=UPI0019108DAC|nr:restriction endonuclease subunit S [Mycobacteroides chelonae]QQG97135.1 restriction endonuclease subunit S [Mycobacteroides chelonae]
MNYPAYPEYKDSGVQWLGKIPQHWGVTALKRHLGRNDSGAWGSDPDGTSDTLVLRSTDQTVDGHWAISDPAERKLTASEIRSSRLMDADLLVTKSSGSSLHIGKTTLVDSRIASEGYCYSNFMQRLRTLKSLRARYAWFLMNHRTVREQLDLNSNTTTGLANLNATILGQSVVAIPPIDEQDAIVDFLDRETAKIDALIGKQEQLITTLREDRIATVTHAVTRGLDPNVETKESGVECLGEIPAGWETSRLKFVVKSVDSGTSVNAGDWTPADDEIGVLKTSCVSAGRFNAAGSKTVVDPVEMRRVTCPVRGGSLIVNRANTPQLVGSTGYVPNDYPNLYLSDKLWQVRFDSTSAKFVHFWSQTEVYRSQIAAKCVGASSSMQNLSMGDFRDVAFGLPPVAEQHHIVEHLDTRSVKLDALIAKSEQMIGVLREYRSALITDAVTGKIDIRGAA